MPVTVPATTLRILHLEDSQADHELVALTLRRAGLAHALERVDSLPAFSASIQAQAYDVILADYRLPGFTALDAWTLVQERPLHPPFILLSGAIGETAAVDAVRLGISDYLLKDDLARLPIVIARALEVEEARRAKERAAVELAASEQRLAALTEHLQTSIEQERAAIAREVHDDIGGSLAAIQFDVAWIARNTRDTEIAAHAQAALEMLQHAIGASQRIQMDLRPPVLEQGLAAAVEWLARSLERRTGIHTQVNSNMHHALHDSNIRLVAYRTAQEALTNIAKQLVYLEDMTHGEEDDGFLDRHVADNAADPLEMLRDQRLRDSLVAAIKSLPEREQHIMGMYYEHDMNLKEIAAVLGVTESRVCQLHSQSIARLRAKMRSH